MIFFILVWLVFAYTCYMVAGEKNRNQQLWGVLGIIFGVFALVVLSLIPKRK